MIIGTKFEALLNNIIKFMGLNTITISEKHI